MGRDGYLCPVCGEGTLQDHLPDGPGGPYTVECPSCGTRFDHDLLAQGANGSAEFLRMADATRDPIAENWSDDNATTWQCSRCNVRRRKVPGDPPFSFCPDCGEPVWRY